MNETSEWAVPNKEEGRGERENTCKKKIIILQVRGKRKDWKYIERGKERRRTELGR